MKSIETIKKLADTDAVFVALVTARYNAVMEGRDLREAARLIKDVLHMDLGAELEEKFNLNHKKNVSTERALDEIYGYVWQDDDKAFLVCGLG